MTDQPATTPWHNYPTQTEYDYAWAVQCRATEIASRDGIRMPRWLPQFRPTCADPIGDQYRRLAVKELQE